MIKWCVYMRAFFSYPTIFSLPPSPIIVYNNKYSFTYRFDGHQKRVKGKGGEKDSFAIKTVMY